MRQLQHRTCARLLPVSPAGEVLLLHGWDPRAPEAPYWFSLGGGVEPGESLVACAVREAREETGLVLDPEALGAPVGHDHAEFDWSYFHLVQDQTYFAVRLEAAAEVTLAGLGPLEVGTIDRAGWWTPDALDADGSACSDTLTSMMRAAIGAVRGES